MRHRVGHLQAFEALYHFVGHPFLHFGAFFHWHCEGFKRWSCLSMMKVVVVDEEGRRGTGSLLYWRACGNIEAPSLSNHRQRGNRYSSSKSCKKRKTSYNSPSTCTAGCERKGVQNSRCECDLYLQNRISAVLN